MLGSRSWWAALNASRRLTSTVVELVLCLGSATAISVSVRSRWTTTTLRDDRPGLSRPCRPPLPWMADDRAAAARGCRDEWRGDRSRPGDLRGASVGPFD